MKTTSKFRNLDLLIAGQFVSQIGDRFYALALAFWVLQTTGSAAKMGLVLFFSMAPSVLTGFFAGALIDRFDRKTILVVTDIFRGITVSAVVIIYYLGLLNLPLIILAQVLLSIASAFFNPSVQAAIPQIVDAESITQANARSQLASGVAMTVGPVLGGLAVSFLGYFFVFVFNAASFLISAVFESRLKITAALPGVRKAKTLSDDIREGYRYIFGKRKILIIVFIVAIIHFFAGSMQVLMPVLANMLPGNGARNLGYFETSFGIGAVASALILNIFSINRKEEKFMFGGVMALGAFYIGFSALSAFNLTYGIPFMAIFLLSSSAVIIISTAYQAIMQKSVENSLAGRVFGIAGSVGNLSLPAASLVFGFLLEGYRIPGLAGICGAALVLAPILLYGLYGKKLKNAL